MSGAWFSGGLQGSDNLVGASGAVPRCLVLVLVLASVIVVAALIVLVLLVEHAPQPISQPRLGSGCPEWRKHEVVTGVPVGVASLGIRTLVCTSRLAFRQRPL